MSIAAITTSACLPGAAPDRDSRFFLGLSLCISFIVLAGFGPSYFFRTLVDAPVELTGLMHLHGLAFTLWIVLLVTQSALIAGGRRALHRRLGYAGIGVAVFMMLMAAALAYERTLTWLDDPSFAADDVLQFLAIPSTTVVYFSAMFCAAVYFRRQGAIHKRLILLATFDVITPAISRLPWMAEHGSAWHYAGTDLLLVALFAHDLRTLRRLHPASVPGGVALVASQFGREWLSRTGTWLDFAIWLTA